MNKILTGPLSRVNNTDLSTVRIGKSRSHAYLLEGLIPCLPDLGITQCLGSRRKEDGWQ